MTLSEAIKVLYRADVDSPEYDAREIFSRIGGLDKAALIDKSVSCDSPEVAAAIARRAEREPLQYIVGECGFYRESYIVTPDCLIPRADTELLVDYAVRHLRGGESFLDLCTGSGCVAISTLCNSKDTSCTAIDVSEAALAVAKKNSERCGVAKRLRIEKRDLLTEDLPEGEYFAILSNPPYISRAVYEELASEIFHEPKEAFIGGEDGGLFYRVLTPKCLSRLKKGGFIAFEIGYDQGQLLRDIAREYSCDVKILTDYGGRDRVAVLTKIES